MKPTARQNFDKSARSAKASAGLNKEAKKQEQDAEQARGSHLKKGAERADERARAANGRGPEPGSIEPNTYLSPKQTCVMMWRPFAVFPPQGGLAGSDPHDFQSPDTGRKLVLGAAMV